MEGRGETGKRTEGGDHTVILAFLFPPSAFSILARRRSMYDLRTLRREVARMWRDSGMKE